MMFVVGRSFVTSVVVRTGLSAVSVAVGEVGFTGNGFIGSSKLGV